MCDHMPSENGTLELLEAKSPTFFLVGGALYAVFVANQVLTTYTGTSYWFASTFAWASWILVPFGLLGAYPVLVERRPYLSRAAAVLAVTAVIAWSIVVLGTAILEPLGIVTEPPDAVALLPLVGMATLYTGYALLGIAVLLVDNHPRAIGVLLLVTAVSVPLVRVVLTGLPNFTANVVNLLAYIAIGVVLLTVDVPTHGVESPADTPA